MHELGWCEGVLAAVLSRAGGRRVTAVGVRIGAVHRLVPEAFQLSFEVAALGTPAEGARTVLTVVPVGAQCRSCAAAFASDDPEPACPRCGGFEVNAHGGDEVVLQWVEYGSATAEEV